MYLFTYNNTTSIHLAITGYQHAITELLLSLHNPINKASDLSMVVIVTEMWISLRLLLQELNTLLLAKYIIKSWIDLGILSYKVLFQKL